jgi:CheY-like chemotaxis protein
VRAGAAAGADGHLTKPISPSSLFSSIDAALDAAAVQKEKSVFDAA